MKERRSQLSGKTSLFILVIWFIMMKEDGFEVINFVEELPRANLNELIYLALASEPAWAFTPAHPHGPSLTPMKLDASVTRRRLQIPHADMVQKTVSARCTQDAGLNWNNCNDGATTYACASCHESNSAGYTCPDSTNYGCATGWDCYKSFQPKVWPGTNSFTGYTHDITDATVYNIGQVSDYFTNTLNALCVPINCWLYASNSNPHWGQEWDQAYQYEWTEIPHVTMDKTTGVMSFKKNLPFYLNLNFRCDNGFLQFDYSFDLYVNCHLTSTVLSLPAGWNFNPTYAISLTQVREPNYEFLDFPTTEVRCPVESRLLYADAAKNPLANGLLDLAQHEYDTAIAQTRYFVQTAGPYRYKKGVYEFFIEAKARGGEFIFPGKVTLTVYCGPLSTNITETTYDQNQIHEVGSIHGFYFTNFSSFSDCPVFTYQITDPALSTTLHPDFPLAANISVTNQSMLLLARVSDTCIQQTYTFKILAIAEGGYEWWTPSRTLQYKCFKDQYSIIPPSDFSQLAVFYKGTTGQKLDIRFSAFVTGHSCCFVTSYELDNNNDTATLVTPAQTSWDTSCAIDHLCGHIKVQIDITYNITFYLIVNADDTLQAIYPINLIVRCGIEDFKTTVASWGKAFIRQPSNTVPYTVNFITEGIAALFTSNLTQCGVVEYNFYNDEALSSPILDNVTMELYNHQNPPTTYVDVQSTDPMNRVVWLQAISEGNKTAKLQVTFTICGLETLTAVSEIDVPYNYSATLNAASGREWGYLDWLFNFDAGTLSSSICDERTLSLWEDAALTQAWNDDPNTSMVKLELNTNGTQRIKLYDNRKFFKQLYLSMTTKGFVTTKILVNFEVCGTEQVYLTNPRNRTIHANFTTWTGTGYKMTMLLPEYQGNFTTTSKYCPPIEFEIYENTGGLYRTNNRVRINPSDQTIYVDTRAPMIKTWYLTPLTHGNRIFLLLNITVQPADNSHVLPIINQPPYFIDNIADYNFTVPEVQFFRAFNESLPQEYQEKQPVEFMIRLSPLMDDQNRFEKMKVVSDWLGEVHWNNNTKEIFTSLTDQIMRYDVTKHTLFFKFENYDQAVQLAGRHELDFNLTDDVSKYRLYRSIIYFIPEPLFVEEPDLEIYQHNLTVDIQDVSPYGDVMISFNRPMKTNEVNLTHINSTVLDIYLVPHNNWYDEYDHVKISKFNLTWKAIQFYGNNLILQLDFKDPLFVSRMQVRDMLVIHAKNTSNNIFVEVEAFKKSNPGQIGRRLFGFESMDGHKLSAFTNTAETYVDRQVPKDYKLQRKISNIEMKLLWTIFWFTVILTLIDASPFRMMINMINWMCLIIHLPLTKVIFPMNVMLYIQQVLPFTIYDIFQSPGWFQKMFRTEQDHQHFENIRFQVRFMGYDQFNIFINMGSISISFWLYFFQACAFFVILWPMRIYHRYNGANVNLLYLEAYKQMAYDFILKQAVFKQILFILLIATTPALVSITLTVFKDPYPQGYQLFTAAIIFICIVLVIPGFLISFLKNRALSDFHEPDFLQVWGELFVGQRNKNKYHYADRLTYFLRRIWLVIMVSEVFSFSPVLQILLCHYSNLAIMIYQGSCYPKYGRPMNRLANYDELLIFACTFHLNFFTEWISELEDQYLFGWSFLIFIHLHLVVHLCMILFNIFWIILVIAYKKLKGKLPNCLKYIFRKRNNTKYIKPLKLNPFIITEESKDSEVVEEIKPEKKELDPYQPTHFLVKGKLEKHITADDEKVERVILQMVSNNEEIVDDGDKWKHQSQPLHVKSRMDQRDLGLNVIDGIDDDYRDDRVTPPLSEFEEEKVTGGLLDLESEFARTLNNQDMSRASTPNASSRDTTARSKPSTQFFTPRFGNISKKNGTIAIGNKMRRLDTKLQPFNESSNKIDPLNIAARDPMEIRIEQNSASSINSGSQRSNDSSESEKNSPQKLGWKERIRKGIDNMLYSNEKAEDRASPNQRQTPEFEETPRWKEQLQFDQNQSTVSAQPRRQTKEDQAFEKMAPDLDKIRGVKFINPFETELDPHKKNRARKPEPQELSINEDDLESRKSNYSNMPKFLSGVREKKKSSRGPSSPKFGNMSMASMNFEIDSNASKRKTYNLY